MEKLETPSDEILKAIKEKNKLGYLKGIIFKLCQKLTELLGDKETIADLKLLLERHPEMFKDMQEVKAVIERVVSEPEIIIENHTPMSQKDYIAGKQLNSEKMGEVGIRNDNNIVKVFHANKKNIKHLKRLHKKEAIYKQSVVGSLNSYTQAQSLDERLVDNNSSPTANKSYTKPYLKKC